MSKNNLYQNIEFGKFPIENVLHTKNSRSTTKKKMVADTVKYQRKYGFEIGSGEHATWNNEADAFKHAYWQAYSRYFEGKLTSNGAGILHELTNPNQPKGEENMDKWNNQVGQEIGKEISEYTKGMKNLFKDEDIEDYIAERVVQRMRAGDLITHPDDPRKFSDYNKIKARREELTPKTVASVQQCKIPIYLMKNKKGFYKGFINEENGTDRIYSVENVGAMSDEEYRNTKKVLQAQIRKIGLPSNHELKRASSGGDVYVHSYTRGDGVHVTDYYRSYPHK